MNTIFWYILINGCVPMKKIRLFEEMINVTSNLIFDYEYKILHRIRSSDFSRIGKIGFENTVMLMLNFFKKSSFIEIYNFFDRILKVGTTVSRQAFEQAREKISYTAFLQLFNETVNKAISCDDSLCYKGYRLLAIDGSTVMLENSKELKEFFGESTPSKGDIFARISMVFDVLNMYIVDADIKPFSVGERRIAKNHIKKLPEINCKKSILIMDRGYWSPELISNIIENGSKFLIRIASNVSKEVLENEDSKGFFTMEYNNKTYKLKFYKFDLKSGEKEILVTNLDESEATDKELTELYFKRWGVETKYKELKVYMQMENFTGKSVQTVLQDFYATVYLSNMVAFAKIQSDQKIEEHCIEKQLKYKHKTNTNITIGVLKDRLILAIIETDDTKRSILMKSIFDTIVKNACPIKPDRSNPRRKSSLKHRKRTVSKHVL